MCEYMKDCRNLKKIIEKVLMQPRCTKTLSFSPDIFVCMTWIELLNLILLKIFYELLLNFCCSHWRETMIDNLFPSTNPINLVPENANCSPSKALDILLVIASY